MLNEVDKHKKKKATDLPVRYESLIFSGKLISLI